ncbi:hypothetical protein LINPERHAP1_LOCUS9322, partial [Linum perenne]
MESIKSTHSLPRSTNEFSAKRPRVFAENP